MKHKQSFNRLDRKDSHRRSLHNNMVTALLRHGRIRTTKAKALEIRRTAERMITRARVDSVHNRRMIARRIHDSAVLAKLFGTIAERFRTRPGGYTRLLKLGPRYGDASEMVILELLQDMLATFEDNLKEATEKEAEAKFELREAEGLEGRGAGPDGHGARDWRAGGGEAGGRDRAG